MPRRRLLIATSNPGKLAEIREVFADLEVEFVPLDELGQWPKAVEDGLTFEANAEKKALHYAARTGLWTLADDSGLEVDALDGLPGVNSARFGGPDQNAAANNAKLIAGLRDVPLEKRSARFRCALAVAAVGQVLATASGVIEGVIIDGPRGRNGFGYDPHFLVPKLGRTTAELSPEHKNRISHRGQALRNIRPRLEALLRGE
ncbi:MAG: RdgB/HAM1 family non-canonical purine NTP pyrophosphatase [Planctomycetota bacterium]